jgi:hypothetical protein
MTCAVSLPAVPLRGLLPYAGMDPRFRESGKWSGKIRIVTDQFKTSQWLSNQNQPPLWLVKGLK